MRQGGTIRYIAVIGGGEVAPAILDLAREVGRESARRGGVLLCGGLGVSWPRPRNERRRREG